MAKVKVLSPAFLFLLAGIALLGCSDFGHGTYQPPEDPIQNDTTGINVLTGVFPSPKEQNPYSVENMNQTFEDFILANNPNATDIPKLEPNFLYVRFLPYGKQAEYELKTYDDALVLFKHPMDYNDIRKPVVYVDESLPDSVTPYFAAVPVGYEFGSTPYEVLQELFLTQPLEEDEEADDQENSRFVRAKKSNNKNKEIAAYLNSQGLAPSQLEMAAFPERFNTEAENDSSESMVALYWSWPSLPFTSKWRPSGTLMFKDENFAEDQPLVGVRVTAGYAFMWRESHTDANGYFKSPERWTWSVDYEANFDSDQFLLEDGHSVYGEDLEIEKNDTRSAWNTTFTGNHAKWSVIWTAAWNYWYGDIYGLKRPRQNEWWNQSLDIWVYYKNDSDYDHDIDNNSGKKTDGNYYHGIPADERIAIRATKPHLQIYRTTIHEIAHSSNYWNMSTEIWYKPQEREYDNLPTILKESYADGVGRYLTNKRYGSETKSKSYTRGSYTGIFEDLEDANSTYAKNEGCDRVSGFTTPMLEKAVFKSTSWNEFKSNLKNDYPNFSSNGEGGNIFYTAAGMDAMFDYWRTTSGMSNSCPALSYKPVPLLAYNLLQINDRAYCTDGTDYCPIVSLGSTGNAVVMGASAKIGSIRTRGSVWLRSRSSVYGDIHTWRTLQMQDNTPQITGTIMQNYTPDWGVTSYLKLLPDIRFGLKENGTNQIPSGQTVDLPPGRYEQHIVVSSGSILRLEPGIYRMGSLTVQSGAKIELPETGSIDLGIANSFRWDGSFEGSSIEEAASRLKIQVQSNQDIFLNASFGGFLVAPKAKVMAGQAGKEYAGQIYADSIILHQHSRFLWVVPEGGI